MPTPKVHPARSIGPAATGSGSTKASAKKPALLAGGNPQIAKADGDAPVQAYIAAMPGWKRGLGRRLDALIVRTVPGVGKAVKWNSPFYGVAGQGWFLSTHCFSKYVKVAFFRGTSLRPVPPGESRQKEVRYLDIREDDQLDEAQMASWIRQAAAIPGWDGRSPHQGEDMTRSGQGQPAAELISKRIAELGDWRGVTLGRMRQLIKEADPDVVEEWKWMGTPVWSHDGIICTGESYRNVVKLTFLKGASLKDPARLFNSSLGGSARRAIDIHEGEDVDGSAFKALVRQAVALNRSGKSKPSKQAKP
jgi:hypothetical protein